MTHNLTEVDSTSNYLSRFLKEADENSIDEFTTISTSFQTGGKGQQGSSWESEKGKNLLFSFVAYPHFIEIRKQFLLSQIVAVSIKETLDEYADGFTVKWPNDIYWKDKKVSGTLIENELQGGIWKQSIVGIGININQQQFVSDAPNPVSLIQIIGEQQQPAVILSKIMARVIAYYEAARMGSTETLVQKYHESLYRKDGFYCYSDKESKFMARIEEVRPEGFLILSDETGKKRSYAFKEVKFEV